MSSQNWDAELYESKHSFVWQYGEGLVDLLAPKPNERSGKRARIIRNSLSR